MVAETKIAMLTNSELSGAISDSYAKCRASTTGEGVHAATLEHYKKLLAEQHRRATEREK